MNKQVKPGGRPLTRPYGEFVPHRRRVRGRWGRSVGGALGSEEKTHRKKMGETGETTSHFLFGAERWDNTMRGLVGRTGLGVLDMNSIRGCVTMGQPAGAGSLWLGLWALRPAQGEALGRACWLPAVWRAQAGI